MVGTTHKNIKVFPYRCQLHGIRNDIDVIEGAFSKANVASNIIPYTEEYSLLLIIDGSENGFLQGMFIKLRRDTPTIINLENGNFKDISLEDNEDIAELSHFVWNLNDKIILAEYNFQAIRYFIIPLKFYFDKKFGTNGNVVTALEDINTYQRFRGTNKEIRKFRLGVLRSKMRAIEDKFPISTLEALRGMSDSHKSVYEITVKRGKRDACLNKDEVFRIADGLKEDKENVEYLIVETSDSVFDLINNVWIHYRFSVAKNGRKLDSQDFFEKAVKTYEKNKTEMLACAEPN